MTDQAPVDDPIAAIVRDLALIADSGRWAWTHGYWPAGRGLDAERGADLARTEQDRAAGPKFDLEIGDHRAREAYQAACHAVRLAGRNLAVFAAADGHLRQPARPVLDGYSPPTELAAATAHATWCAEHLAQPLRWRAGVDHVRRTLDATVRQLSKALDQGTADGIAHNEPMCKTCGTRPMAERAKPDGTKRPERGGECDTCATWRRRNGGPRPKRLDQDSISAAREAQARRRERGEDWGAA